MNGLEIFGYLASVIVALSLMMKEIQRLRWYNLLGAAMFSVYGAAIQAWPVAILNAFIALADIWYLLQIYRQKEFFETLSLPDPLQNAYIQRFLSHYEDDIARFFPRLWQANSSRLTAYFILRNMLPVSLVILEPAGHQRFRIILDYAIPAYRDLKNARYFFHHNLKKGLLEKSAVFIENPAEKHIPYLKKLGFRKFEDRWELSIP
jgi:hypothetical protein